MARTLVHVGFGNMIVAERIVAIIQPASSPVKRLKEEARAAGRLIDATKGRKTRAIIVTDSNHVLLSAIQPETIVNRISEGDSADDEE
ncbi:MULTISPECIES: DUF370 domain-containing protein [Pyramidobacter]|uniref:Putative regulatory protein HMPREF7215_0429 n=2 Tax=Pyramidobacter TaxID=638847 RepID=A0ABM9ZYI2_9BACT|nr:MULTISPECIES: DUF370 domain-containing protein [Pyramidobacter]EFB91972.1 hypothetical protein HMPREF7215_0429 [Pyramidobacter piscolens W5455]MCI6260702.1 DUF370 domain-containing protein [Pyramidobacter sp.]MCI7404215.1 DUF370 domain-containing protein [Pyramidobacter sp.]MDY2647560.1 DUF370 domain-containing protein [Pyramidobacter porci]MDY3212385.1 DUF370 domain-containing protein [Pyramidobacter sp.]